MSFISEAWLLKISIKSSCPWVQLWLNFWQSVVSEACLLRWSRDLFQVAVVWVLFYSSWAMSSRELGLDKSHQIKSSSFVPKNMACLLSNWTQICQDPAHTVDKPESCSVPINLLDTLTHEIIPPSSSKQRLCITKKTRVRKQTYMSFLVTAG